MTLKLYELTNQYRLLLDKGVDAETGEIIKTNSEELFTHLDEIKESIEDKAENIGKLYLELQGEINAVASEIFRLGKHKARLESNSRWLKDYLLRELPLAGIEKVERPTVTVAIRDNPPSVNIIDEELVPRDYRRHIPERWEVDKKGILDNYKSGGDAIQGTEIVTDKKRVDIK